MSKKKKKGHQNVLVPSDEVKSELIREFKHESCYDPEYHPLLCYRLALLKLTDPEIASVCGISDHTLWVWKDKYPELSREIDRGRLPADGEVVEALHKRAVGFYYYEECVSKSGEVREVRRYALPDTTAAQFFLSRRNTGWKDKNNTTNVKISIAQQAESINQLFGLQLDPDKMKLPGLNEG